MLHRSGAAAVSVVQLLEVRGHPLVGLVRSGRHTLERHARSWGGQGIAGTSESNRSLLGGGGRWSRTWPSYAAPRPARHREGWGQTAQSSSRQSIDPDTTRACSWSRERPLSMAPICRTHGHAHTGISTLQR